MAARRRLRDGVAPLLSGGSGPDPGGGVRSSGWGSRSQAPYGTVGAVSGGEQVRLAGGPRLAAKRRVPGGDTWTPQEREEAFGSRCRVAAEDGLDRPDLGRLLEGCGQRRVLMAIPPERRRGRAGCRKPGPCVWRDSDLE
ncbi:hypothetical protein EI555_012960 [Monodon monoceros]|uniref:Uncharacterized protein n=1 Tax=Monodon monoceros TaxID=40151 RepID=A0A4U1FDZ9_MONMO|nr:hypothetical protein EI555_012960 [Monodon monoceros]